MAESEVSIERLALLACVRGEPERLEPLRRRLREMAGERLQRALSRISIADTEGAALYIETLAIDCSVNSTWDDEAIATQIARGLAQALNGDVVRRSARRFTDRAEFVAAWLLAMADGATATRWWFD